MKIRKFTLTQKRKDFAGRQRVIQVDLIISSRCIPSFTTIPITFAIWIWFVWILMSLF